MPLTIKTQNDSFAFVHELKQEMHADLKYVESLENEIDELESDKAEFSNMYDILLQECVSNDVMCSYLHSLSDLDAHAELQCLYVHKVKECECLAQKLLKQTETVSKEVYNELLRSFAKLEKHLISLELALQQCQEQMKNDTVCKEKASNVFLKEREQYFEIQDLKAQLQDKDIAISELKKLIEKNKGKGVDTNFEKQSILGKPPLQPIRNQPVVRQPTAYKSERSQLPRYRIASQVGVSHDLTKPVTPHSWPPPRSLEKCTTSKIKALNTKPSVQQSARLPNTANGNKPKPRNFNQQPRNWPPSMSSRVSNRIVNIAEPPRNQKTFLKSKDLACPTCKKCIYSANHDECILKYLSKVNSRASAQKKDAQSHKTTKRYMPVEKKCDSKKHDRQIPIGQKFSPNKSSNVYLKTTPPRSGLTWKPTGRIFTQVGLKWIPIRKSVETRYNTNDSASPLGKETHNPKTVICANSSSLSAGTSMASEPISSKGSSNAETESIHNLSVFTKMNSDIEDDIMDPVMQCTTLPSHWSFSQQKLVSFVTEIHMNSIDFLTPSWLILNRLYGGGGIPFQLKSDSLPHAPAQTTKTYYKHQDSRIKKAQELKIKTFANSDIKDNSLETKLRGRLLESFQGDAKYEHVGQDTRSQGGKDDQANKEKI
ncbi:hypothetical protein Tco_1570567 [Tanacetum coccineum]